MPGWRASERARGRRPARSLPRPAASARARPAAAAIDRTIGRPPGRRELPAARPAGRGAAPARRGRDPSPGGRPGSRGDPAPRTYLRLRPRVWRPPHSGWTRCCSPDPSAPAAVCVSEFGERGCDFFLSFSYSFFFYDLKKRKRRVSWDWGAPPSAPTWTLPRGKEVAGELVRPQLGLDSKAGGHDSGFGQVEGVTCSGLDLSTPVLGRPLQTHTLPGAWRRPPHPSATWTSTRTWAWRPVNSSRT